MVMCSPDAFGMTSGNASRSSTVTSITAAAPKGAPQTLARPPTAAITTSRTETPKSNACGLTNCM
jgi:hypothetical protein